LRTSNEVFQRSQARPRVAGLEREPAAVTERGADRPQRPAQLVVADELLEGVAGHDRQVELAVPGGRGGVGQDPLDVAAGARLVEHGGVGVEPAQPARVPGVAGRLCSRAPVPQPTSSTLPAAMTRSR
jgi:hypothetical protein